MKNLLDYIRTIPDKPIPGILFFDITTLIENPEGFTQAVDQLVEKVREFGPVDKIVSPEARGFIFGAPVARQLNCGLVLVRKPGKLPAETISVTYELEYGTDTLTMHKDSIKPGDRVCIIDDLLATGGTIDACCQLVGQSGGTVAGSAFIIELTDLKGREKLAPTPVRSLIAINEK